MAQKKPGGPVAKKSTRGRKSVAVDDDVKVRIAKIHASGSTQKTFIIAAMIVACFYFLGPISGNLAGRQTGLVVNIAVLATISVAATLSVGSVIWVRYERQKNKDLREHIADLESRLGSKEKPGR